MAFTWLVNNTQFKLNNQDLNVYTGYKMDTKIQHIKPM